MSDQRTPGDFAKDPNPKGERAEHLAAFHGGAGSDGLSDSDREILDFARKPFGYAGNHESAVRDQFGVTRTAYFQRLNKLIDHPEATKYAPDVVKRYQSMRAKNRTKRQPR
jgi:hypothetical protein